MVRVVDRVCVVVMVAQHGSVAGGGCVGQGAPTWCKRMLRVNAIAEYPRIAARRAGIYMIRPSHCA